MDNIYIVYTKSSYNIYNKQLYFIQKKNILYTFIWNTLLFGLLYLIQINLYRIVYTKN